MTIHIKSMNPKDFKEIKWNNFLKGKNETVQLKLNKT